MRIRHITSLLEAAVFVIAGTRLLTLKAEITPLISGTLDTVNDIYHEAFYQLPPEQKEQAREAVEQNLQKLMGTWKTTCDIPARPGWQAVKWSIVGLNKIPPDTVQAQFGDKVEPCPKSYITHQRGSVGLVEGIQDRWDAIEYWLLIPGVILVLLRLYESFWEVDTPPKNKKQKTRYGIKVKSH